MQQSPLHTTTATLLLAAISWISVAPTLLDATPTTTMDEGHTTPTTAVGDATMVSETSPIALLD